jgi:hypothetical protein
MLSPLTLPQKSVPCRRFEDFTFLIYGERKIGKTTLFSQFADPFFFMFEPGGRALSIKQAFMKDWETALQYLALLEKSKGYCKTVIMDTGYMAYERCFEYCLRKMGIIDPKDKSFGSAWKLIDKEFRNFHLRLYSLGLCLGVTAHSEIKEVQTREGVKYDKLVTQLSAQANRYYCGTMDVVGYYQYDTDGKRVLTIRGDTFVDAGSRIKGHFLYKGTQEPIINIPMGSSEEEGYANLVKAFNNDWAKNPVKLAKVARVH